MADPITWGTVATVLAVINGAKGISDMFDNVEPSYNPEYIRNIVEAAKVEIIGTIKMIEETELLGLLDGVATYWNQDVVPYLKSFSDTRETVASPENGLSDDTIIAKKGQLDQITYYFEHADQEYETYAVLVLAYNLRLMLTTAQAATRLARNANDSSGKENIVAVLTKAIAALQAWPAGYVIARAKHVSVEMEMKRQGPTDWLGHARDPTPTGQWIMHDNKPDRAVASLEGKRTDDIDRPKTIFDGPHFVSYYFDRSDMKTRTIPQAVRDLEALKAKALSEVTKPDEGFDKYWYRLKNFVPPYLVIDVINDGAGSKNGQIHMVPEGDFTGQYWRLRRSTTSPGYWNLCTMFLGTSMCLDVYGDDKTRPHLAPAGNYSGQQWKVESWGDGSWKLTNAYSGPAMMLDVKSGTQEVYMSDGDRGQSQHWGLWGLQPVTELGI